MEIQKNSISQIKRKISFSWQCSPVSQLWGPQERRQNSAVEVSWKPSGSCYTRRISTVWTRRWNEKPSILSIPGFVAPDTTRRKVEEKWHLSFVPAVPSLSF